MWDIKSQIKDIVKETLLEELVGFLPNYYLPIILSLFVQLCFWANVKARAWRAKEEEIHIKLYFSYVSQKYKLAMDRCLNVMSVGLAEKMLHRENTILQNAGFLLSLHSFLSPAVTAQFWKVKTSLEGESCILFTQHLPILTSGTMIFFSEPHCHVWHCFLSGDSVRLTFSSYSSGLSGYPRSGDRVYNTHWSLGPQADGPRWQQRASNLQLQLELLGESICLSTGVSNKVRFGI